MRVCAVWLHHQHTAEDKKSGCRWDSRPYCITVDYSMQKPDSQVAMESQSRLPNLKSLDQIASTQQELQDMTNRLHVFGKKVGLRISGEKTKAMTVDHVTNHSGRTEHREGCQVPIFRKLPIRKWRRRSGHTSKVEPKSTAHLEVQYNNE